MTLTQRHTGNLPVITLTTLLRNTRYAVLSSAPSSRPFSTPLPLPPFLPRQQRRYVSQEPGPSHCCWPQHPFPIFVEQSNSHNIFRPYEDPEHDIPSCEPPSENSLWSNLTMRLTEIQDSTLKHVDRVDYLTRS